VRTPSAEFVFITTVSVQAPDDDCQIGIHHAEAKNYEKPKRADPSYYGDGHDDTGDKKIQVKSKRIRHDVGVYR
jgi:hypothetical protein